MAASADRPRLAAAALAFALACCLSYAGQRLWDARTEPPPGTVLLQATIPYYWRVGATLLHGGGAALILGLALDDAAARRWLGRAPWLVPLVVLPAALAMALVP
jgi:hypothetical protein